MTRADFTPWLDRSGRFSLLRAVVFVALLIPICRIGFLLFTGMIGPEPVTTAMNGIGEWTLRILLVSLAITPLRRLVGWSKLITVRRMVGLIAFAYVVAHFLLYILNEHGDLAKVASEIYTRLYLTIGFVALIGLAALAATSFDRAIRRMGKNWRRLHKLSYPLTALGILHFFMQAKIDVTGPVLMLGVFIGLMLHRLIDRVKLPAFVSIIGVAILSGLAAAGLEALWYAAMTGAPAWRVLIANLDFSYDIRPAWFVAAILGAPVLLLLWRQAGNLMGRLVTRPG